MRTLFLLLALLSLSVLLVACYVGSGPPLPDLNPSTPTTRVESTAARTPSLSPKPTTTGASPAEAPVTASATATKKCTPTLDDGVSPSYIADTPVRSKVGSGHVLSGMVLSSRDCAPIANAMLELWPEIAGKGHPDEARATVFTDSLGRYHFESDLPEHIHMRISAAGYRTIGQNSYHPEGQAEGTFDIVLEPEEP